MDLNLYLGLPRSPRPRSYELGSDLSLSSFPPPASSDSGESRAPEATSMAMKASASHAPHSPSPASVAKPTVREIEGPSIEQSPSNSHVLQAEQVVVEAEKILGHHFADDNSAQGVASQTPYSPSFHDDEDIAAFLSLLSQNRSEPNSRTDGFRIQRNIESHSWWQSSLRQSLLCGTERTDFAPHTSASPEQLIQETSSQQTIDTNGKLKAAAEVVAAVSSENEAEEKNRCAANFGCNICSDIANEPVVTSCGHLFCWPCLYHWLHVQSDCKECPVCNGGVTEANITPIYGRGCSRSDVENKDEEKSVSGRSIPARPRGNRLESWRHCSYPILERVGEGIANPWRHFLMQEVLSGGSPAIVAGFTTRRVQREQEITDSGPSYVRDGGAEFIHSEIDTMQRLHCLPAIDSLASMNSEIGLIVGRCTENTDFIGPSLSVNEANPGQFVSSIPIVETRTPADQASFSSTTAVICSESSVRGASAEPNCAGSSRPCRRVRGSSSSGSSDDGGNLSAPKRRKLC